MPASRRPARRPVAVLLGVLVTGMALFLVTVVVAAAVVLSNLSGSEPPAPARAGDGLVPADVARDTPAPLPGPLAADVDLTAWAGGVAEAHDLPRRAVLAYGAAELTQRADTPGCGLSWATLAGIGRVESRHGNINGSEIDADGVARPPIVGIALDGSGGTREVADTDGGRLDDDPALDRAVGPMQFLPATWQRYGADGNGDGVRDPQQIDDAALGAARYLCAEGRDTASGEGWWDGVLTYNSSLSYGRLVWAAVQRYGDATTP